MTTIETSPSHQYSLLFTQPCQGGINNCSRFSIHDTHQNIRSSYHYLNTLCTQCNFFSSLPSLPRQIKTETFRFIFQRINPFSRFNTVFTENLKNPGFKDQRLDKSRYKFPGNVFTRSLPTLVFISHNSTFAKYSATESKRRVLTMALNLFRIDPSTTFSELFSYIRTKSTLSVLCARHFKREAVGYTGENVLNKHQMTHAC